MQQDNQDPAFKAAVLEAAQSLPVKVPETNLATVLPQKIKLDPDLAKRLQKLNDKQIGIQQFVGMIQQQGESRIAELVEEGRAIWNAIASRYNLDVERVQYNLDKDGVTIIPVGMKL